MLSSILSDGSAYRYVVKAGPGTLFKITAMNDNAATRFLRVYDKATVPAPATDTPVLRYMLFPNGTIVEEFSFPGADVMPASGIAFSAGIAYVVTTGAADTDVAPASSNDCMVNVAYK